MNENVLLLAGGSAAVIGVLLLIGHRRGTSTKGPVSKAKRCEIATKWTIWQNAHQNTFISAYVVDPSRLKELHMTTCCPEGLSPGVMAFPLAGLKFGCYKYEAGRQILPKAPMQWGTADCCSGYYDSTPLNEK